MVRDYSDLSNFIDKFGSDDFKPFAYYDKHLDCIRVRIRDCSVIEERLSSIFTILKAAHSDYEYYVGFNIKGVRHLLDVLGLPHEGSVRLADIIDGIIKEYPDTFVKMVQEEFRKTIEGDLEVEVDLEDAA